LRFLDNGLHKVDNPPILKYRATSIGDQMPGKRTTAIQPEQFATFGQLLRFLRQRAGLTQRELSIAVGYSESQLSRLEQNQRAPDQAALAARFVPALHVDQEPIWATRLLELGAASHAEGGPDEPAPAAEAPLSPHNLPAQLTSFIGRERELAEIQQLLTPSPDRSAGAGEGVRLLTLTGHGGTGKTRLALQAATALLASFPDGVWWVELAPLTDLALIPQAVAAVLGLKEEPDRPLLATLIHHLRGKRALLILDNCEHLIQASAQFAEAVLRGCPHVRLLDSSREMLGVAGERALVVPSLLTPEPRAALSLDAMRNYDAVRLFVARASTTAPHFTLTAENASAVVQVCWRLDGIPLALELAAARLRMMPVEELAARLDDAFRLLTGGSRTALPRHQTLQALIDWSYELLPDAEQKLLRWLAVFAGGWTLAAAEAVCAGDGLESSAVAGLLGRLIDKSLVLVAEQAGAARYRLMETIRQYAQAKLAASGEADKARGRHAAYYLVLAEAGAPDLRGGLRLAWLDRMELEHDNLRAALGWGQSAPSGAELGLRLSSLLLLLWLHHGYWREARGWLEAALAHPGAPTYPHMQAEAMVTLGLMLGGLGDYVSAKAQIAHGLRLSQELGDRPNSAWALERLGWIARERGDGPTARARLEESLALYRELGDQSGICLSTMTLAEAMIMQGDLVAAKDLLEENLRLARQLEDLNGIGWTLNHLGHIAQLEREYTEATRLHEASLQPFHQLGAREGYIWAHQSLGETYLAQGNAPLAASHFAEALMAARDLGDPAATAWCLAGLAGAAAVNEEPERAAWLWGAAEALRQSLGVREAPASHATHERLKAMAQEQIGQTAFAAARAEGQAASLEQALAQALDS
jgi:predicted ATPase/DNA-binding transcriptional regulator YiaG